MTRYSVASESGCRNCYAKADPDGDYVSLEDAEAYMAASLNKERREIIRMIQSLWPPNSEPPHPNTLTNAIEHRTTR